MSNITFSKPCIFQRYWMAARASYPRQSHELDKCTWVKVSSESVTRRDHIRNEYIEEELQITALKVTFEKNGLAGLGNRECRRMHRSWTNRQEAKRKGGMVRRYLQDWTTGRQAELDALKVLVRVTVWLHGSRLLHAERHYGGISHCQYISH